MTNRLLNKACLGAADAPGFLKLLLCRHMYVYVYVCVNAPRLLIITHVKPE